MVDENIGKKWGDTTFGGFKYPTGRDVGWKTGARWLEGKRKDDGAEGLWRIGDKLYDLSKWIRNHPGGSEWLTLTEGTDITEAFEAHHITLLAEKLLPNFYIRDAVTPRSSPLTFKPDGFYRKFKGRVREALKDVDIHTSARSTNFIADFLFIVTLALCVKAAIAPSWLMIVASGIFLTWTAIVGHNFLHQRDTFRMYYMDLSLMSSREWRIMHILSHHLYTNTIIDLEITIHEPIFYLLPRKDKSLITRYFSWIYFPLVYCIIYFLHAIRRVYSIFWEFGGPELRDAVPLLIPTLMCLVAPPSSALVTYLKIIVVASFHFGVAGLHAAHQHPEIYHDGDVRRKDMDFGLAQVDTVRDRLEIEASTFLVLTNFGSHTLHHLLPTIDHTYLHLCQPAFEQTCKEFGVSTETWPIWKMWWGFFKQLENIQPNKIESTR
ncbi:cytochrome b5-related protein [Neodiprion lecontei]|uniref:Cytochrome b5-related protein n=1 Tax=Neodiprion lecontei TaxID=441921 RepID=A0A6J0BDI5_NEOLC|nr:cytochrome b5-related protein [Neodiprion lecontei]XP_046426998.1 cytochrome b5-related protein-like [Neodiprion fabricii]